MYYYLHNIYKFQICIVYFTLSFVCPDYEGKLHVGHKSDSIVILWEWVRLIINLCNFSNIMLSVYCTVVHSKPKNIQT